MYLIYSDPDHKINKVVVSPEVTVKGAVVFWILMKKTIMVINKTKIMLKTIMMMEKTIMMKNKDNYDGKDNTDDKGNNDDGDNINDDCVPVLLMKQTYSLPAVDLISSFFIFFILIMIILTTTMIILTTIMITYLSMAGLKLIGRNSQL